jgi:signal transduction histidine kinase
MGVREHNVGELVAKLLAAPDAAGAYRAVLDGARAALRGDGALLLRARDGGVAMVSRVPASGEPIAADALAEALHAAGPVTLAPVDGYASVLAVRLRARGEPPWALALLRARDAWTTADARALAQIVPYLELGLEHGVLRAGLAAAAEREAAAAAEHERFLSVISHELRNPLAPILMWTSTLRRLRATDPEVQRAAQAIGQAVALARRLIEALLDLSRLDRGVIQLSLETLDLRDVVESAVAARRAAASEAQVALDEEIPPDPLPVRGDPVRLGQVAGELLDNAIKFTPTGGRVSVAVTRCDGHAELAVRDSGPGVPADVAPRLFTPFVQGPNARGGLGLGLALAQRFLALQHGTIRAAGGAGSGAAFVVTLPLERPKR